MGLHSRSPGPPIHSTASCNYSSSAATRETPSRGSDLLLPPSQCHPQFSQVYTSNSRHAASRVRLNQKQASYPTWNPCPDLRYPFQTIFWSSLRAFVSSLAARLSVCPTILDLPLFWTWQNWFCTHLLESSSHIRLVGVA